jgi:hypothetical protein
MPDQLARDLVETTRHLLACSAIEQLEPLLVRRGALIAEISHNLPAFTPAGLKMLETALKDGSDVETKVSAFRMEAASERNRVNALLLADDAVISAPSTVSVLG